MRKQQRSGFRYKTWCVAAGVCMLTAALCGCGGKYPELTDDEEQAIRKYAATLLYENDQNRESRLMSEEEMIVAMQRRAAHAYMPEPEPTPEPDEDKEHSGEQPMDDLIGGGVTVETRTLAEFFGLSGIDISYQGYFFTKSYPEASGDEFYFAMDALYGNELLILQYTITNQNSETAQVDILNLKPRFRAFINDGGQINAMTTLLLDDMKTTNCTLEPGESIPVVVVFEVTEEEAASMQQLRLTVKTEQDSWTVSLLESGTPADSGWDSMQEPEQGDIVEGQAEESEDGQQAGAADAADENGTNTPTTGERNALGSARDYLAVMPFSYNGLIEQLEYEQYTHDEAVYAADHCEADWNEQAGKAAKAYLEVLSFSRDGLIEQLEFDGFTHEQAVYGAEQNGY